MYFKNYLYFSWWYHYGIIETYNSEFAKGGGKYVVVYWWWNHNLCVRYVYLLKAGLNMEINRKMEILSCRWTIWVLLENHKNRWYSICPIWNYYDYASGYFGVINSSLHNSWTQHKLPSVLFRCSFFAGIIEPSNEGGNKPWTQIRFTQNNSPMNMLSRTPLRW